MLRLPSVLSTGDGEDRGLGTARSDDGIMELEFVKFVCQAAADKVSPGCSPGNGHGQQGSKPDTEAVESDVTRRTGGRGAKGGDAEHDAGRERSAAAEGAAAAAAEERRASSGRLESAGHCSVVGDGEFSSGNVGLDGNLQGVRRITDEELLRQRQRLIELQSQLRVRLFDHQSVRRSEVCG